MRYSLGVLLVLATATAAFPGTAPPGLIFTDGFETGDTLPWDCGTAICSEEQLDSLAEAWILTVPESQTPESPTPWYNPSFNTYQFQIFGDMYEHPRDTPDGVPVPYHFPSVIRPWLEDTLIEYIGAGDYDGDGVRNDSDPNPLGWTDDWGRDADCAHWAGEFNDLLISRGITGEYIELRFSSSQNSFTYLTVSFSRDLVMSFGDLYTGGNPASGQTVGIAKTTSPYKFQDPDGDGTTNNFDPDPFDNTIW